MVSVLLSSNPGAHLQIYDICLTPSDSTFLGVREGWASLLRLLPPRSDPRSAGEDGWRDGGRDGGRDG